MQTIVEGNPGSGKTYFAVRYLMNYCKYDPLYREFVVREDVVIISNVEGMQIKHLKLEDLIERFTVEKFFTVENFEKIQKQYHVKNIVLIVDEAQKIFDSKFYDKDVFFFFQYHRHLGLDIFLLTQSRSTLPRQLLPLCEYFVQAKPRSKTVGSFVYDYLDPKGNYMYSKTFKKDKKVFQAYKSFNVDEIAKPRNVLAYYIVLFAVVGLVTFGLFKFSFAWFKPSKHGVPDKPPVAVQVQKPVFASQSTTLNPIHAQVSSVKVAASSPPLKQRVELDAVIKDGGKTYVTVKGYRGCFRLPCRYLESVDLHQKTAVINPADMVPYEIFRGSVSAPPVSAGGGPAPAGASGAWAGGGSALPSR